MAPAQGRAESAGHMQLHQNQFITTLEPLWPGAHCPHGQIGLGPGSDPARLEPQKPQEQMYKMMAEISQYTKIQELAFRKVA